MKRKKSKKQKDKATISTVTREMALPRFSESARKEQADILHHHLIKHNPPLG
jgi:hypothetical protein